jgi:hypothetical protein
MVRRAVILHHIIRIGDDDVVFWFSLRTPYKEFFFRFIIVVFFKEIVILYLFNETIITWLNCSFSTILYSRSTLAQFCDVLKTFSKKKELEIFIELEALFMRLYKKN